jgi:quercetin dioxygenase-like cupin family protein
MEKYKNKSMDENSFPIYLLAESSPSDYEWETFHVLSELSEINHFGYYDCKEAHIVGKHRHPGTFEFTYIEQGKTSWEINDFHYETKAGDLFYTRPDEFHSASRNILEP